MGVNPLYNEIYPEVKDALDARGRAYGKLFRGDKLGVGFPYKKTAFGIVQAIDNEGNVKLSLGTLKEGGFTSLYNTSKFGRNLPSGGTLQSLSISNQGEFGSQQKTDFSFNVYTPEQLSYYETMLMTPGTNIRVKYGWSVGSSEGGTIDGIDVDEMEGIVYNFSYSVNPDGSFSCQVQLVGKGFYAASVSSEATLPGDESPVQDEQGNAIYASNLKKWIEKQLKGSENSVPEFGGTLLDGVNFYAINLLYDPEQEEPTGDEESNVESSKIYYLTLNSLIEYFNERVLTQIERYEKQNIRFSSDLRIQNPEEFTAQSKSAFYKEVVSSEPENILFSNQLNSKYGDTSYEVKGVEWKFDESTVNLGEILISTDLIVDTFDKLSKENEDEPAQKSISAFLSELLTKISYVSGGIYQLTVVIDEPPKFIANKSENLGTRLVVVDTNYTSKSKIKPYLFTRTINRSLIKDMSMSSKLPNEAAVQMYSGGKTGMTAGRGGNAKRIIDGSPADDDVKVNEPDEATKALEQLSESKKSMGQQGSTFNTRSNLRSALTKFKANPPDYIKDSGGWIDKTLYPISLSLKIDGIGGLRFGNVITTDWLPDKYKTEGNEIVFVITKVDHTISNNQWETSIETQCRMKQ